MNNTQDTKKFSLNSTFSTKKSNNKNVRYQDEGFVQRTERCNTDGVTDGTTNVPTGPPPAALGSARTPDPVSIAAVRKYTGEEGRLYSEDVVL